MKKRLLIAMAGMILTVSTAMAVPAKPGLKKKVQLSDGTTVELTLKGDEHYSYYLDETGAPCQVVNGRLIKMDAAEVGKIWTERKNINLHKMSKTLNARRASRRAGEASSSTTGTQRGLVILMQFPDNKFVTENAQQVFKDFFNKEGFNKDGMNGSVRDYFKAQSYNQLTIDFDVMGPYTTKQQMAYYGQPRKDNDGKIIAHDSHPVLMVAEAVDAASKDVNFKNYDWDGDGEVDQVFVIYAGYAEAQGADENTIWPHEYALSAEDEVRKYNDVVINVYACASELAGSRGTVMDGIGTACHEFSHCLGLPDMYDTSDAGTNFGMGNWDIMCSGSYNDDSRTPAGYTSYERWFSKWMEPKELNTMTRIKDMKPLVESPEAYILYNEGNKNEYYMLENRQPISFDKGLNGHGLLILHIDYNQGAWLSNTVNNTAGHERVSIIPADNVKSMYYSSLMGDPFPGSKGITSLTNYTTPAATVFNTNSDGSNFMNKSIDNITEDEAAMTVSFVACRPEMATPEPGEGTEQAGEKAFKISWPAVEGAVKYEIELTTISKAPDTPEEALQRAYTFDECYSKTAGFTDISSKLGSYGLSGWSGSSLYTSPEKLRLGTSTKSGSLKTPTWKVPSSQNLTIVMGANIVKNAVTGSLTISYGNAGDPISGCPTQTADFEVTTDGKQVFHFKDVRKDLFWIDLVPKAQMYLNYFAIYDGIWTAEQLGINHSAQASRRASVITNYTSDTNSFTFTDLDTSKRFAYRVRALGEENTVSQWSEEKSFEFSTTGINSIHADTDKTARYFDLQGREVDGSAKGLLIRRQGSEVRKVMVK